MSNRFGASGPSRSKNAKLKVLIACMLLLLLILFGTLAYVVQNSDTAEGKEGVSASTVPAVAVPSTSQGILIPLFRIEEGSKLAPEMFRTEELPKEQIPAGAYTSDLIATLGEKFAKRIINPNVPLLREDVSDSIPLNTINIPSGFRLITIIVDSRSGVEGWAKPGTRVDVLWTFVQETRKKVATIARFVKVVSVAGNAQNNPETPNAQVSGPVTVSLLVTEAQAKGIELARTSGDLSLVLVGGSEMPGSVTDEPGVIDVNDVLGHTQVAPTEVVEVPPDGVLYDNDPVTGKQRKFVLIGGKWSLDKSYTP